MSHRYGKVRRRFSNGWTSIVMVIFLFGVYASAEVHSYIVQSGDTLSSIIQRLIPGRIYGPNGNLARFLSQNPKMAKRPNKIYLGESLTISQDVEALARVPAGDEVPASDDSTDAKPKVTAAPVTPVSIIVTPAASFGDERSYIKLAPRFSYNRIDATDKSSGGTSTLGSTFSLGAEIDWEQVWSKEWSSEINVGFDQLSEQTTGKTIDQASFTRGMLGVSAIYHPSSDFRIYASVGASDAPFIRATGATSIVVDSVVVPEIKVGVAKSLIESKLFKFSLGIEGGFRLGSSEDTYSVQNGYDYGAFLQLEQKAGKIPLFSQIFYSHISQGTSITDQSESILGLSLGVRFDLTPNTDSKHE